MDQSWPFFNFVSDSQDYKDVLKLCRTQVIASYKTSTFLTKNGYVCCSGANHYGECGVNKKMNEGEIHSPMKIDMGSNKIVSISGKGSSVIVIDSNFQCWSFGWNSFGTLFVHNSNFFLLRYGQLGLGDGKDRIVPTKIQFFKKMRIVRVSCFCHSLFLDSNGIPYSCGLNWFGRLGLGNEKNRYSPEKVVIPEKKKVVRISGGGCQSMFLCSDGSCYVCGDNSRGQLGIGMETKRTSLPLLVESLKNRKIIEISSGSYHQLWLDEKGYVAGSGEGKNGALGMGNKKNVYTATINKYLSNIKSFDAGEFSSIFFDVFGNLFFCGRSQVKSSVHDCYPVKIVDPIFRKKKIVGFSAGINHSIFLDSKGGVYFCGSNKHGMCGVNTAVKKSGVNEIWKHGHLNLGVIQNDYCVISHFFSKLRNILFDINNMYVDVHIITKSF